MDAGASGAHACHAAISSAASSIGRRAWKQIVWRRRDGAQRQARHHAELAAARAAERPQQVLARLDHAPVGEHDLGRDHLVARQPVPAPEDAKPAAEREPGDPTVGPQPPAIVTPNGSSAS